MSGRATGEERSPLSVPERERERDEAPRFTIEEASAPSLPRGVRVSIAATLIHLVNHCWPSSAGREGGREGSTIDLHRRDRFLDSAVDRGRMHRVFRKWLRAHRSTPPSEFRFAARSSLHLLGELEFYYRKRGTFVRGEYFKNVRSRGVIWKFRAVVDQRRG